MSNSPTLLIVDDSRTSRLLIRGVVATLRPHWRILDASNGDEALQLVEQDPPQFISMDVNMPGASGLEIAGRIRLKHPQIRIVLCTANIQDSVRQIAARVGLAFVPKPITERSVKESLDFWEGPARDNT